MGSGIDPLAVRQSDILIVYNTFLHCHSHIIFEGNENADQHGPGILLL